jgi:hypothetical protein
MVIDERDAVFEIDPDGYRVEFSTTAETETFRLVGAASVDDVIQWARFRLRGRVALISAEIMYPAGGLCLVHVAKLNAAE